MDSSRAPSVYVLEVAVVMGDAANPEPRAEHRADVAAVLQALEPAAQADRFVHPRPDLRHELEEKALGHFDLEVAA
jgi:hypothetical protein